jgi:hypothetical protein
MPVVTSRSFNSASEASSPSFVLAGLHRLQAKPRLSFWVEYACRAPRRGHS